MLDLTEVHYTSSNTMNDEYKRRKKEQTLEIGVTVPNPKKDPVCPVLWNSRDGSDGIETLSKKNEVPNFSLVDVLKRILQFNFFKFLI